MNLLDRLAERLHVSSRDMRRHQIALVLVWSTVGLAVTYAVYAFFGILGLQFWLAFCVIYGIASNHFSAFVGASSVEIEGDEE